MMSLRSCEVEASYIFIALPIAIKFIKSAPQKHTQQLTSWEQSLTGMPVGLSPKGFHILSSGKPTLITTVGKVLTAQA